jgi:putative tricarboxylic transport membrane protein
MELVGQVIVGLFNFQTLLMIVFGTFLGVFVGAVPGLNGAVGVALLVPFTFGLSAENGLLLLGGIYMGSQYGGAITAILLNTPGDVVATCTAMEGYPLAKQGRAKEALYVAIISCVFGGFVGVLTMIGFTPLLAGFALKFGPGEMFLVAIAGLSMSAMLTSKNVLKGFFGVFLGLLFSCVGVDSMSGTDRLTFGLSQLKNGISLIPVIIGLFAISEMIINLGNQNESIAKVDSVPITLREALGSVGKRFSLLLKSSFLGTFIGVLPATGGAVATFVAYAEAKRTSKRPETFGRGNIDGIIAPESANNGAVGGSLVPLLALGVPGSTTAAIMYSALTIHGLIPGPRLFENNAYMAYTFTFGMLLTVVVMGIIGILGIPFFSKIVKVKFSYIVPIVLSFCFLGAYSINNSAFDIVLAVLFGVLGVAFKKNTIPPATVVMGLILGPIVEKNFRRALTISLSKGTSILGYIFSSPLSFVILVVVIFLLLSFVRMNKTSEKLMDGK